MSLSHSTPKKSSPLTPGLSGPDFLRAHFGLRQRLRLNETAECLGMSYSHLFRRVQAGTLGLQIRKNEVGERFVLLDDLIAYIFPPSETDPTHSSPSPAKKRPGRPRKIATSDGQKGGAR